MAVCVNDLCMASWVYLCVWFISEWFFFSSSLLHSRMVHVHKGEYNDVVCTCLHCVSIDSAAVVQSPGFFFIRFSSNISAVVRQTYGARAFNFIRILFYIITRIYSYTWRTKILTIDLENNSDKITGNL